MVCASDLDGMLFAFPNSLILLLIGIQKDDGKAGILTARPESEREMLTDAFKKVNFKPDFIIGLDKGNEDISHGTWKGKVCKDLDIDILFDDFEYSDPKMIADFFCANEGRTTPFTSWAYRPQ